MSTKKQVQPFPSKLYVYEEKDGDDTYYIAATTLRDAADAEGARLVATYWHARNERVELRVKRSKT